jgi:alkylation response protein AidB-like acyl-CoA dehydrogenase
MAAPHPIIENQVNTVVDVLKSCLETGTIDPFFTALRRSDLLHIPLTCRDLCTAHRLCADVLRDIGRHCVGAAYALENHYFVLGAAVTYQSLCPNDDLQRFLNRVLESRLLVANTRTAVHTDITFSEGARATADGDSYAISGRAAFVSIATFADVLWLQVELDARPAVFIASLGDQESISVGELSFPNVMLESDTHSLQFNATKLRAEQRISVPYEDLWPQGKLATALEVWHDSLIAAQFLGAAAGALEEVTAFTQQMKTWGGKPFAQLDNVLSELGRLGMSYAAAAAMIDRVSASLDAQPQPLDDGEWLTRAIYAAKAANWFVTTAAEDIVTRCRRIVGTRAFRGPDRLERLSTEAMIGPLVPRGNPVLEVEYGRHVLERLRVQRPVTAL